MAKIRCKACEVEIDHLDGVSITGIVVVCKSCADTEATEFTYGDPNFEYKLRRALIAKEIISLAKFLDVNASAMDTDIFGVVNFLSSHPDAIFCEACGEFATEAEGVVGDNGETYCPHCWNNHPQH